MEPHYGLQRPPPAFMVRPPQPVLEYDQAMLTKRYDALRDALVQHGNEQPKVLDDFRLLLQHIMRECSRANIESGKTWIFEHCRQPLHIEVLTDFLLALSNSKSMFEERLHLIYLINDILFHRQVTRRQLPWMKEIILPRLVPLLRLAYQSAGPSEERKAKVMKVITIWGDKHFFDASVIDSMRENVVIPPPIPFVPQQPLAPPPPMSFPPVRPMGVSPPGNLQRPFNPIPMPLVAVPPAAILPIRPPPPEKRYFELPAGLMVAAVKLDAVAYTAIDPELIKVPHQRPVPSKELLDAVEDFYTGLNLTDSTNFEENTNSKVDRNGRSDREFSQQNVLERLSTVVVKIVTAEVPVEIGTHRAEVEAEAVDEVHTDDTEGERVVEASGMTVRAIRAVAHLVTRVLVLVRILALALALALNLPHMLGGRDLDRIADDDTATFLRRRVITGKDM
ncbi:hypothetical protein DFQ30_009954 [Apophysomyces sp. BC1015]|nr:hypothetical protein DFQ30_009954 [Apophysomyces sp. BC1015]